MNDDGSGIAVGFFIGIFVAMVACLIMAVCDTNRNEDRWRRDCVTHGAAEWVTTEDGTPEWRWK
jgi:hypothetical protein